MFCPLCGKRASKDDERSMWGTIIFCHEHGEIIFRIVGEGRKKGSIEKTEEVSQAIRLGLFDGLTEAQLSRALMYYRDGKSIKEISSELGVARGAIIESLVSAKKKLVMNYAKHRELQ